MDPIPAVNEFQGGLIMNFRHVGPSISKSHHVGPGISKSRRTTVDGSASPGAKNESRVKKQKMNPV